MSVLYKNMEKIKPAGLDLKDKLVAVQKVTKVTKGGRGFRFSAIVVAGDGKGIAGFGLGKSKEVAEAVSKALDRAKKNLVRINLNKSTIYHDQEGKFGGARVFLKPASHGTGIIAGGAVRMVLDVFGVKDILSKSKGSSNPHNVVKATFNALMSVRDAHTISRMRGVSMIEVFKG